MKTPKHEVRDGHQASGVTIVALEKANGMPSRELFSLIDELGLKGNARIIAYDVAHGRSTKATRAIKEWMNQL